MVLVLSPAHEYAERIGSIAMKRLLSCRKSERKRTVSGPVDVVVSTPQNLLVQIKERNLFFGDVTTLVVDEADTMFDHGFGPELTQILGHLRACGSPFSTVLVSATPSDAIRKLVKRQFKDMLTVETSSLHKAVSGSVHNFVPMQPGQSRLPALIQVQL
jgi:superfamily II DNA/RNA helicase